MELLAPAGNRENFTAAMAAGADAVYVGAPAMNARNLARDLSLEEIWAMVDYCHNNGKKIYLAANSLLREQDLEQAVKTLAVLEMMECDGLIVQDLGLIRLLREYFPSIPVHASTLLSASNSTAMQTFKGLGIERVVLARELTLKEIAEICGKTDLEIEVFVHGAMCFSASGLCLFSSFLGGKSGLRGKCVQPCRRHYSFQEKGGGHKGKHHRINKNEKSSGAGKYLFSMNDLSTLELIPQLREAGVASLKIEGRLRSAHYVSCVVQAYRLVMDATPAQFPHALAEARRLEKKGMGRATSPGYYLSAQPAEAIMPHHSGNMGEYLGRLGQPKSFENRLYAKISLKGELAEGDRLRLHSEPSGERLAFSLREIRQGNERIPGADSGQKVQLMIPEWQYLSDSRVINVYRVDVARSSWGSGIRLADQQSCAETIAGMKSDKSALVDNILRDIFPPDEELTIADIENRRMFRGKGGKKVKLPMDFWLRVDSAKSLFSRLPFVPDRFLVPLTKGNIALSGQLKRHLGKRIRDLTWCLPPIMFEGEVIRVKKQIGQLARSGYRSFQIGHISQYGLFGQERVFLSADYTVNILNSQAVSLMGEGGFECVQLSIESDRNIIREILARVRQGLNYQQINHNLKLGLTVYGAPALFTSRLNFDRFQYGKTLTSPRQENFSLVKKENTTVTVPDRPFSLLPYLHELKDAGLDYMVVDMSNIGMGDREIEDLGKRLAGSGSSKLPTFNYLGDLE